MKRILAVLLALGAVPSVAGQIVRPIALGMRLRVHSTAVDGSWNPPTVGILEHLYPDSLTLRPKEGEPQTIPTNRDTRYFVQTGRKNSFLQGGVIGTLAGVLTGAAVFAVAGGRSCPDGKSVCPFPERTAVKGGMIFGLIGAGTGFAIGAFSGHDIWRETGRESRVSLRAGSGALAVAISF